MTPQVCLTGDRWPVRSKGACDKKTSVCLTSKKVCMQVWQGLGPVHMCALS